MLEKPFIIFLSAVIPSAVLVGGAALLLTLTDTGRALPESRVESSTHAKLERPTARIDPISALILPAALDSTDPDQTASVPGRSETVMEPDTVEHGTAFTIASGETNVPPTSAPDAVSPLSEAPEKTENIELADPTGGSLKSVSRPNNKPNARAYGAGVYAALARYKPTAVQRGSTTVTFEIGATGALNDVRVGKSSGNSQVDQLARQTVRNAAPFSPPPNGASSYTIQIEFR